MVESGPYVEYNCMVYVQQMYVIKLVVLGFVALALLLLLYHLVKNCLLPLVRSWARQRAGKRTVASDRNVLNDRDIIENIPVG